MATEMREGPKTETGACENAETDGETADADIDRILVKLVERLSRPEHEDGKEVTSGIVSIECMMRVWGRSADGS